MPKVIDKRTGRIVSREGYNKKGMEAAENRAASSPDLVVQSSGEYPTTNARDRVEQYNIGGEVPNPYVYKEGGEVKKKKRGFFSKEKRAERQEKRNLKKMNKRAIELEKKKKGEGVKYVKASKDIKPSKIKATGRIRRKSTSVTLTEGGAYATYKKKSGAAKSFRSAFSKASKAGKKTFTWDGRKYSTKKKDEVKKYKKGGKVKIRDIQRIESDRDDARISDKEYKALLQSLQLEKLRASRKAQVKAAKARAKYKAIPKSENPFRKKQKTKKGK
jgi:hypothetical protein